MRQETMGASSLQASSLLVRAWAEQNDIANALEAARSGEEESAKQGNRGAEAGFQLDIASLLCKQGKWSECVVRILQATALDNSPALLLNAGEILGSALQRAPSADRERLKGALNEVLKKIPIFANNRAYELTNVRLRAEQLAAAGNLTKALLEARRAVSIDQQYRRHEQLVRFLLAAAEHDHAKRTALREEAREALKVSAQHKKTIWLQVQQYRPGMWNEDLRLFDSEFPNVE
jgi:hypothetical protein